MPAIISKLRFKAQYNDSNRSIAEMHNGEVMNWRMPYSGPEKDRIIAVLICHNKEHLPLSYEVHFGRVEYSNDFKSWRANTQDMSGKGWWCPSEDGMVAWAYSDEFEFPEWAKHDPHWGPKE